MKEAGIFTRRYFYPLISSFAMYRHLPSAAITNLPCANDLAEKILCLPIYPDLKTTEQDKVLEVIRHFAGKDFNILEKSSSVSDMNCEKKVGNL